MLKFLSKKMSSLHTKLFLLKPLHKNSSNFRLPKTPNISCNFNNTIHLIISSHKVEKSLLPPNTHTRFTAFATINSSLSLLALLCVPRENYPRPQIRGPLGQNFWRFPTPRTKMNVFMQCAKGSKKLGIAWRGKNGRFLLAAMCLVREYWSRKIALAKLEAFCSKRNV